MVSAFSFLVKNLPFFRFIIYQQLSELLPNFVAEKWSGSLKMLAEKMDCSRNWSVPSEEQ